MSEGVFYGRKENTSQIRRSNEFAKKQRDVFGNSHSVEMTYAYHFKSRSLPDNFSGTVLESSDVRTSW